MATQRSEDGGEVSAPLDANFCSRLGLGNGHGSTGGGLFHFGAKRQPTPSPSRREIGSHHKTATLSLFISRDALALSEPAAASRSLLPRSYVYVHRWRSSVRL